MLYKLNNLYAYIYIHVQYYQSPHTNEDQSHQVDSKSEIRSNQERLQAKPVRPRFIKSRNVITEASPHNGTNQQKRNVSYVQEQYT